MTQRKLKDIHKVVLAGAGAYLAGPAAEILNSEAVRSFFDQTLSPENIALFVKADPGRAAMIVAGIYVYRLLTKKEDAPSEKIGGSE